MKIKLQSSPYTHRKVYWGNDDILDPIFKDGIEIEDPTVAHLVKELDRRFTQLWDKVIHEADVTEILAILLEDSGSYGSAHDHKEYKRSPGQFVREVIESYSTSELEAVYKQHPEIEAKLRLLVAVLHVQNAEEL